MNCQCFQAWSWWQHNVGILKTKRLEPDFIVLKIRINCTEISVPSEVLKSCTWNQILAFELSGFQRVFICYNQMAYNISAGTGSRQIVCPRPISDASCFDPLNSLGNALFTVVLLVVFLKPEAWHWSSNTDSDCCAIGHVLYLLLSTFPTGQWTTKSIQSDSVPDTWGLMQGLCGASCHRGRPGRNLISRDITPSVTEDKSANPTTLLEKGFVLWLRIQHYPWHCCGAAQKLQQALHWEKRSRWGTDCTGKEAIEFTLMFTWGWFCLLVCESSLLWFPSKSCSKHHHNSVFSGMTAWHENSPLIPATPLLPHSCDTDHHTVFLRVHGMPGQEGGFKAGGVSRNYWPDCRP